MIFFPLKISRGCKLWHKNTNFWFCSKWNKTQLERLIIEIHIKSWIVHSFWLVLTYDQEYRGTEESLFTNFALLLDKTNRLHVALCLFSYRSQMISKCSRNTLSCAVCATSYHILMSSVICYWTDAQHHGF